MKFARTLNALGLLVSLVGCRTCWIDRDDDRPMKYGSIRDCVSYGWWGECFHPKYHGGPPDGLRDHVSVKKAAVKAANQSLSEQDGGDVSRDFKFGYQQAYIDIANGGSGALPAVPPPRYWTAPYRTTWGHNKARDWFSGYQAGACSAKCCMPANTLTVPTSVCRDGDNRHTWEAGSEPLAAAPIVHANYGWPNGAGTIAPGPMMSSPYPMPNYGSGMNSPTMQGPMSYGTSPAPISSPPMMNPPGMAAPYSNGFPGGGWSSSPSPALPSESAPAPNIPAPAGGGHSIPSPGGPIGNPPAAPPNGLSPASPPAAQTGFSPNNPWGQFHGVSGFGFRPEGAAR